MADINQQTVDEKDTTTPEEKPKALDLDIEKFSDEEKLQLAEKLKVKYFEENKSLKEFKAKIQAEKDKAEKLKLEEEGKYKELSEIHKTKVETYKKKLAVNSFQSALIEKGISKGALNLAISAYSDKLEVDDDDNVVNLESIVSDLESNSPEIFNPGNKAKPTFNQPANSSVSNSSKKMPYSQWTKLSANQKIEVRNKQGVDYSR